jgi:hypothetical protein
MIALFIILSLVGLLLVAPGVTLIWLGVIQRTRYLKELRERGVTTQGKIVRLVKVRGTRQYENRVTFQFVAKTADGGEKVQTSSQSVSLNNLEGLQGHSPIQVRYLPEKPAVASVAGLEGDLSYSWYVLAIGLIMIAAGGWFLYTAVSIALGGF